MSTDDRLAQCANALLATMTLEEKAGQLSQYFYFGGWAAQNELVESQVRAGQAGSLLPGVGDHQELTVSRQVPSGS